MAKLRKSRGGRDEVCFDTPEDTVESHSWARVGGKLVGLTALLDGERVDSTDTFEGTLEEALRQPWDSDADRAPYLEAMHALLFQVDTSLEAARTRQRAKDLEDRLSAATGSRRRPAPFRDGRRM